MYSCIVPLFNKIGLLFDKNGLIFYKTLLSRKGH